MTVYKVLIIAYTKYLEDIERYLDDNKRNKLSGMCSAIEFAVNNIVLRENITIKNRSTTIIQYIDENSKIKTFSITKYSYFDILSNIPEFTPQNLNGQRNLKHPNLGLWWNINDVKSRVIAFNKLGRLYQNLNNEFIY